MSRILKLSLAFLREYRVRMLLTSLATIASACVVVWVVSGYDALLASFDDFSDKALGRYTLSVAPISTYRQYAPGDIPDHARKFVPPEVVAALRADPAVQLADPMWAERIPVQPRPASGLKKARGPGRALPGEPRADGASAPGGSSERGARAAGGAPRSPASGGPRAGSSEGGPVREPDVRILGTDANEPPFPLVRGNWIATPGADEKRAALSADAARKLGLDVGDELLAGRGEDASRLRIVGIVDVPVVTDVHGNIAAGQLQSPSVGGLYVSTPIAEEVLGEKARISFVGVTLKPEADLTQFRFSWSHPLSRYSTPVQFQEAHDIEEALDQSASAENIRMQAYAATGMSLLAALFIVFSTLNMSVGERARQLAVLRAVVLTRAQVGLLILTEGLLLGTIGFIGGMAAGRGLLWVASKTSPELFGSAPVVGTNSIFLAAACAYGGALLASILPAWRAMRVRPIDAMAPRTTDSEHAFPVMTVVVGIALIAMNPLLTYSVPMADDSRIAIYMLLGCTSMAVGFVLLAPSVVMLVDRFVSPVLARLFRIEPKLLAMQMTSNLWRSVGTSVALTVGLGLFIAIQVWGYTMLDPFVPGAWAPDALIAFRPDGISPEQAAGVARLPGIDRERCLPIVAEQPRLLEDLTHSAERASVTRQDSIVMIGIDPTLAFGGEHPLLDFEWKQRSPEQAIPMLEKGRGCLVPEHFLRESGLQIGSTFALVPPEDPSHPVEYVIAGAVEMPGWHWQTKPTGFRTRTHRAAAMVLAKYDDVARDFGLEKASHVWFAYDSNRADTQGLAEAARDYYGSVLGRTDVAIGGAAGTAPYVRIMPVEGIRAMVRSHAEQWIWGMSRLPLVTLIVTGVALLNSILASVRSRRWDLGVLRAIGFTSWTLVALVVVEGLLVGIVACTLSVGFGVVAGWCGAGMSQYASFFGGLHPSLDIPWPQVLMGLAAALVLSALAAIWPAISMGRTKPLTLLAQGRNAF